MTNEHIERLDSLVKHFDAGGQTLVGPELSGRYAESIRALLSASNAAVPEGWKLVPMEPTDAMTFVGQKHRYEPVWSIGAIYREMGAASPAAPAQPDEGWTPTPENINALPRPVREFICALESNADPAGMVRENAILKHDNAEFESRLAAAPAQSGETDKWVAKVRVTHKGYSMELSKYIAYALPEGVHELYAAPQPSRRERPADVEQCGCQISYAEFSSYGELKRVTIHYGESRVAYVTLPAQSAEAGEDERSTLTFDDLRLWHRSQREHFLACADVQSKAAERPFFDEICFRKGAAFHADAASLLEARVATPASVDNVASRTFEEWASEPQRTDKIPLAKHPNGAYSDTRSYLIYFGWKSALQRGVAQPRRTIEQSCPRCELPLSQDCNCDAAYVARAASPQAADFDWPPLPTLPNQSFYAFDQALFTDHQMQGYANAYGKTVRDAMSAAAQLTSGDAWTDAGKKVPEDEREVVVFLNGHCGLLDDEARKGGGWGIRLGFFDHDKRFWRVHGQREHFVTHWQDEPRSPHAATQRASGGT